MGYINEEESDSLSIQKNISIKKPLRDHEHLLCFTYQELVYSGYNNLKSEYCMKFYSEKNKYSLFLSLNFMNWQKVVVTVGLLLSFRKQYSIIGPEAL